MRSTHRCRQSYRLQGYDYSLAGAYFVTVCTHEKQNLFGDIFEGEMTLNESGRAVLRSWFSLEDNFPNITLDEFMIMPNHVHGIVWIADIVGAQFIAPTKCTPSGKPILGAMNRAPTLGKIVRTFKAASTHQIREFGLEYSVWQRNYHDRIIRNEKELELVRFYIRNNPSNWQSDEYGESA